MVLEVDNFSNRTFSKFKFILEAVEDILLPEFKGSTFREAFGRALQQILCPVHSGPNCG